MDFKQALKKVKVSAAFKATDLKDAFLAHAFVMLDNGQEDWQIGYFSPSTDRMLSFVLADEVQALPPAEVLKSNITITPLKPADVKISTEKALAIAEDIRKEHYNQELPMKMFFIVQHLPEGAVYNITTITKRFTTINIKVLAKTGKVFKHTDEPLIQFDKGGEDRLKKAVRKHNEGN